MLDTRLCAYIMHERPEAVLTRLEQAVLHGHRIVISAITWAELFQAAGAAGPVTQVLADAATPVSPNDTAIAGHAIAAGAVLVTMTRGRLSRCRAWCRKTG